MTSIENSGKTRILTGRRLLTSAFAVFGHARLDFKHAGEP
jgi:hypothetical protein